MKCSKILSYNVQLFFKEIGNKLYSCGTKHEGGERQNINIFKKICIVCKEITKS